MKKTRVLSILFIFCLLASLIFSMLVNKVYASEGYETILNFGDGIIHDGYVEYPEIGKIQLYKDDVIVSDIYNDMKIDLKSANYNFRIIEDKLAENTGSVVSAGKVRLTINKWVYAIPDGTFKLDPNKFYGTLNIKLERTHTVVNTKTENDFTNLNVNAIIDLTKEYSIDFSKNDELTESLKLFADLEKTLYYKNENGKLVETTNVDEAIIKIVGNKDANKAIITAVNVGSKKEEQLKDCTVKYMGSKIRYEEQGDGVVDEIRTAFYTICTYDFTFKYVKEEVKPKEYNVIEGANQTYTIDKSKNATFRVDAEYSLFESDGKVYVDDVLVDSKNYTSKSGSTIITLIDTYLKTLSVGEHTLKVSFADGGSATTKFIIKEEPNNTEDNKNTGKEEQKDTEEENKNTEKEEQKGTEEENKNTEKEEQKGTEENKNTEKEEQNDTKEENKNIEKQEPQENVNKSSNPKTGDNIMGYIAMFVISIAGISTRVVANRKK